MTDQPNPHIQDGYSLDAQGNADNSGDTGTQADQGYIGHKLLLWIKLLGLHGSGQINQRQHAENIGLHQRFDDMQH